MMAAAFDWLASLHLLRPHGLWALAALPVWLWLLWRGGGDAVWREAVDPALRSRVLVDAGPGRRRMPLALLALAWCLAVLALAGPAWHEIDAPMQVAEAPLVIAVDLSSRQRAGDLPPSRIVRMRIKLRQLLGLRTDGQVGLLAYAESAHTVAPLTDDVGTVAALIDALDPSLMPADGQRADRAIARAARLLDGAGFATGDILLLSDRADARAEAAAAEVSARGYRVSVLGLGTTTGAPVADAEGNFARIRGGDLVLARLQPDSLRALARAGGGGYAELTADDADLRSLGLAEVGSAVEHRDGDDRAARHWRDEGPWLLLLVLPLVLVGARRAGFLLVLALAFLPLRPAAAFGWDDLWQRPDQQADAAMARGAFETARDAARDPDRIAAAAYRAGDYAAAALAWSGRDDAIGHYNRGNALAQLQRFDEAIAAYDRALALDPDLTEAAANRAAVEQARQQQRQQPGGGDSDPGEPQDGESQDGESQPGSDADGSDGSDGSDQGDQGAAPSPDAARDQSGRDRRSEGAGESSSDAAPEADSGDPQAREAAEQALREAMDAALAERQGDAEPGEREGAALGTADEESPEDEQRRALEQTLRRLPDDPGGLLRRKFAIELQNQQRNGEEP